MGATGAMYDSLRREMSFQVSFIDWPAYGGETTYKEIAQKIIDENNIHAGDVIGGSSLGGMVALEIARSIQPAAVILIGSAMNKREVNSLLMMLSPLAAVTPIAFVQLLAGKQSNLVSAMFAESNPDFIRAMCSHLPSWSGYHGERTRIFRIHGARDHIIPAPSTRCDVVRDAGHLLAITHPREVADFLKRIYLELLGK
jgi:pimeloyl-ACP methyl ester carboxylesterase